MITPKSRVKPFTLVAAVLVSGVSGLSLADGHSSNEAKAHKKFTECAAIRMKEINLEHLKKSNLSKYVTAVPEGWTVVSGTGGEGHPKLLLCR